MHSTIFTCPHLVSVKPVDGQGWILLLLGSWSWGCKGRNTELPQCLCSKAVSQKYFAWRLVGKLSLVKSKGDSPALEEENTGLNCSQPDQSGVLLVNGEQWEDVQQNTPALEGSI